MSAPSQNQKLTSILILLALILFFPGIFLVQGAWLVGDHAEQHYPWAIYLSDHIKHFQLPFWTNLIQSGFPITAEGQIGSFYLPNLLFYFFLPIRFGYAWNILFHLFLSGILMGAYLRTLKLDERAVLYGVIVYLFGSTLGGAYYNITSLKVLCWLPAGLLVIDRMWKDSKFRFGTVPLLGFIFFQQLVVGYLQYATYAVLFSLLYGLFRIWEPLDSEKRPFIPACLALGAAVGVCTVLSFPQLFLTFRMALESNRANMPESFAYISSYAPPAIFCMIFPSLEGFFASKLYLGILPLFFIILSILNRLEKPFRSIFWLAVIAFLLALGQFSPLYIFIVKVLHFHFFRTPTKFIFFAGFFLSILAACGIDKLLKEKYEKLAGSFKSFWIFLAGSFVCALLAFLAFKYFSGPLNQLGEWLVDRFIYGKPGHPHGWEHYQTKLRAFIAMAIDLLNPRGPVILIPVLKAVLALTAVQLFISKKIKVAAFYLFALALTFSDLYAYSFADIQRDYAPYSDFYRESRTAEFLKQNLGDHRYFIFSNDPSSSPLPAGKNMPLGLKTANAYSPLIQKRYYDFMANLGGINDSTGAIPIDKNYLAFHLDKLRLLSVKYVVADQALDETLGPPAFEEGKWKTYLLQSPSPFFFFELPDPASSITISESSEEFIRLETNLEKEQLLIFSSLQDSGWHATIDGVAAETLRAHEILIGLRVPAGKHQITFNYQPFRGLIPFLKQKFIRKSA